MHLYVVKFVYRNSPGKRRLQTQETLLQSCYVLQGALVRGVTVHYRTFTVFKKLMYNFSKNFKKKKKVLNEISSVHLRQFSCLELLELNEKTKVKAHQYQGLQRCFSTGWKPVSSSFSSLSVQRKGRLRRCRSDLRKYLRPFVSLPSSFYPLSLCLQKCPKRANLKLYFSLKNVELT